MEADIRHTASWKKVIDGFSEHDQEIISAAESSVTCQNLPTRASLIKDT